MSAIQHAIESLGLDKRCSRFCMMCDLGLQERFDSAGKEVRKSLVGALAGCDWEDADNLRAALGLVVLLPQELSLSNSSSGLRSALPLTLRWLGGSSALHQLPHRSGS